MVDVKADPGPMILAAAKRGNEGLLTRIFDENKKKKLNVNPQDGLGNTPLHYAATGNHLASAKMLLEKNGNPNIQNYAGDTAFHKAIVGNNMQMIKLFLEHSADPRIANKKKLTPSHIAKSNDIRNLLKKQQQALQEREKYEDDDMIDEDDDE